MANLLDVFAFISVLLRGLTLAFEALLIGGIAFQLLLARYPRTVIGPDELMPGIFLIMRISAAGLGIAQLVFVSVNCLILTDTTGLLLSEVVGATFAIAGLATVLCSLFLILYLTDKPHPIAVQVTVTAIIAISSVATSHSWSRLDNRLLAASLTFLHHFAAGIWIGALPYLLIALHRLPDSERLSGVVRGFSCLAMAGVAMVLMAGGSLTYLYLDSPSALYATSYGAMVVSKLWLMAGILSIGAANFFIIRKLAANPQKGFARLRRLVEAEIGIGFTVILAAASLVSQPPAIDLAQGRATWNDIEQRFTPRIPRLKTPALSELSPSSQQALEKEAEMNGTATSYVPGSPPLQPSTPGDIAWSEYNHHWAGLIVAIMGLLAVVSRTGKAKWTRHWPLLFIGLAVFLFLRADPENWPLGPNGFWESFLVAEVLQHRFFTLLVVGFAIFEWRVQNEKNDARWMSYVFPVICALGGAILLTHSHSLSNVKEATLIELSHIPLAVFAVFAGWSRWLELRMAPESHKVLSWIWPICFVMIGTVLLLYREA